MDFKYIKGIFFLFGLFLLMGQGCLSGSKETTTGPAGMFVSTNQGDEWQSISLVPTVDGVKDYSGVGVYSIIEDKNDPEAMYWLTRGGGMLYTYDGGRSWTQSTAPYDSGFIFDIAIDPEESCKIFATNGRQVHRSDDCGRSWLEVYLEGRPTVIVRSLAFDPFDRKSIYALTGNGDLFLSRDDGLSWAPIKRFGHQTMQIIFDTNREGLVYIPTMNNGLQRSFDKGATWESLSGKLGNFTGGLEYRAFQVYPTNPNQIYWVSKYGILYSKNAGEDWDALELITPPGSAFIYGLAVNPQNDKEIYYTGTVGIKSTFYKTVDGSKNWVTKRLPSGQVPTMLRVHPLNEKWVYLGFTVPPKK